MEQNTLKSGVTEIPVIDYEGSHYKSDFWLGQGRDYEDAAERLALGQLLPAHGGCVAEIGAGFGRLSDLYLGYDRIILFDYSRTLLADAVAQWGADPRFIFVAGNIYHIPLATGILDSLVMVRVMHHLADVPSALQELESLLHKQSVAVLEYANKRNLKAILRWLIGKQEWSPFDPEPLEFIDLNFDFHPLWMQQQIATSSLKIKRQLAVSHFRLPLLKNLVDAKRLARVDEKLFQIGGNSPVSPSVFLQVMSDGNRERSVNVIDESSITSIFRCPTCRSEAFDYRSDSQLVCGVCHRVFANKEGVWDFKEAVG